MSSFLTIPTLRLPTPPVSPLFGSECGSERSSSRSPGDGAIVAASHSARRRSLLKESALNSLLPAHSRVDIAIDPGAKPQFVAVGTFSSQTLPLSVPLKSVPGSEGEGKRRNSWVGGVEGAVFMMVMSDEL